MSRHLINSEIKWISYTSTSFLWEIGTIVLSLLIHPELAHPIIPVLLTAFVAGKIFKTEYADNVGMLCGAMANPFALDYADPNGDGEDPAVAYATVYPASIFLRVISAQIIMLIFL